MARLTQSQISKSFIQACLTEVRALKPGNVHIFAGGHGMQVADFETSARAAAPHISNPELRVGERILKSVEATFAAVHCNTNLGILLLCAPLAMAAEVPAINRTSLQERLKQILADLTDDDTRNVFQAIARATPGGLGDASEGDVRKAPRAGMTLLHAMQLAAPRDLIAVEYTTGFERIFDLAGLLDRSQQGEDWSVEDALAAAYIRLLGRVYDTHIARKHGLTKAIEVRDRAIKLQQRLSMSYERRPSHPEVHRELLAFDAELKAEGLNPGTLADLIAAAAFIHNLNTAQIA